ncbi:MAG TPA: cation:proton antiporter, partial [Planctomycetota bacterium]|nr:cation:proton antiporter [Planctomycetota bacterium]
VGAVAGVGLGYFGRWLLVRVRLTASGLYAVVTLGLALLTFGLATVIGGSGFVAVFAAAVVLGTGRIPYHAGLRRIHDALAWLCQVAMFLMLGFLVFPSRVLSVLVPGLVLALFLTCVARPIAVALCLAPFRYPWREVAFVGWVGLRGAVPIILATYPVLSGVPEAARVFDIVFCLVVVNALIPGATLRRVTRWARLEAPPAPQTHATLEITSMGRIEGDLLCFHVEPALMICDAAIRELPMPDRASIALVVRGRELVAARGDTVLLAGDQVYVFCRHEDLPVVTLLFGRPEEA